MQASAIYDFEYNVKDDYSHVNMGHTENRNGDNSKGQYFVDLPDGRRQTVRYYVDGYSGYVADVQYTGETRDLKPSHKPTYEPAYKPAYKPAYEPVYTPFNKPTYKPAYQPEYKPVANPAFKSAPDHESGSRPSQETVLQTKEPAYTLKFETLFRADV